MRKPSSLDFLIHGILYEYEHRALQDLTVPQPWSPWIINYRETVCLGITIGQPKSADEAYAKNPFPDSIKLNRRFFASREIGGLCLKTETKNVVLIYLVGLLMSFLRICYEKAGVDSRLITQWQKSCQTYLPNPGDIVIEHKPEGGVAYSDDEQNQMLQKF